jgi:hypothetical protein
MQAKPCQPLVNDNWQKWWDSRQMHSKPDLLKEIKSWNDSCNQKIVDGWLAAEESMSFSVFDEASNTWEFGIIMCSENFSEILPLLVFCEGVFSYKLPSSHDFAIIYPYLWEDSDVMAYMTFAQDGAVLTLADSVADVAKDHLDYTAFRLGEECKAYQEKMNYD